MNRLSIASMVVLQREEAESLVERAENPDRIDRTLKLVVQVIRFLGTSRTSRKRGCCKTSFQSINHP